MAHERSELGRSFFGLGLGDRGAVAGAQARGDLTRATGGTGAAEKGVFALAGTAGIAGAGGAGLVGRRPRPLGATGGLGGGLCGGEGGLRLGEGGSGGGGLSVLRGGGGVGLSGGGGRSGGGSLLGGGGLFGGGGAGVHRGCRGGGGGLGGGETLEGLLGGAGGGRGGLLVEGGPGLGYGGLGGGEIGGGVGGGLLRGGVVVPAGGGGGGGEIGAGVGDGLKGGGGESGGVRGGSGGLAGGAQRGSGVGVVLPAEVFTGLRELFLGAGEIAGGVGEHLLLGAHESGEFGAGAAEGGEGGVLHGLGGGAGVPGGETAGGVLHGETAFFERGGDGGRERGVERAEHAGLVGDQRLPLRQNGRIDSTDTRAGVEVGLFGDEPFERFGHLHELFGGGLSGDQRLGCAEEDVADAGLVARGDAEVAGGGRLDGFGGGGGDYFALGEVEGDPERLGFAGREQRDEFGEFLEEGFDVGGEGLLVGGDRLAGGFVALGRDQLESEGEAEVGKLAAEQLTQIAGEGLPSLAGAEIAGERVETRGDGLLALDGVVDAALLMGAVGGKAGGFERVDDGAHLLFGERAELGEDGAQGLRVVTADAIESGLGDDGGEGGLHFFGVVAHGLLGDAGAVGGLAGGALGWIAGIGALAIPGAGPFIAAGPIMAALSGMAVGATIGGIAGALIGMGIPELEAKRYEGKIKAGNILISVHTESADQVATAKKIFRDASAEDIGSTGEAAVPKDQQTKDDDFVTRY